jgi:acyl dehydratase
MSRFFRRSVLTRTERSQVMHAFQETTQLQAAEGSLLGNSSWLLIDQKRIDEFANATGDYQWIHVDTERARRGPYGTTIAHGLLTLSLLPMLGAQVYSFDGWSTVVNYGFDRVRFLSPVRCESRLRVHVDVVTVTAADSGTQAKLRYTVEIEDEERPACVAEMVLLLVP